MKTTGVLPLVFAFSTCCDSRSLILRPCWLLPPGSATGVVRLGVGLRRVSIAFQAIQIPRARRYCADRGGAHTHRRSDRPDRGRGLAAADRPDLRPTRRQLPLRLGHRLAASWPAPRSPPSELGPIDAVLLSHDHHDDNLDPAGRALLPSAGDGRHHRLRCEAPRRRRARPRALGDAPRLEARGPPRDRDHRDALPPRASRSATRSSVTWSASRSRWEGQGHGALWISGDTVLYDGVRAGRRPARGRHRPAPPRRRPLPGLRAAPLHDDRDARRSSSAS